MSSPMIQVERLSKRYHIGARETYATFCDAILQTMLSPVRRLRNFGRSSFREEDTIWALKDVSFEVQRGEVVGIIGRNGAGKSTLLKILSRVTDPTEGHVILKGRVGSLLEVGTGFHPELTGRDNIYLSGAILGMKRQEIRNRFDEIVDFSGVEKFIDTPVKRYSNGMRVRLGFAVAAHLEPEIMLVDEVLAVGDAEFRRKCLRKMSQVSQGGRTVLFVSHNMSAILNLCSTAILLTDGRTAFQGDPQTAMEKYLHSASDGEAGTSDLAVHRGRPHSMKSIIRSLAIKRADEPGTNHNVVRTGDNVVIEIGYDTGGIAINYVFIRILSSLGQSICSVGTHLDPDFAQVLQGKGTVECVLPGLCLSEGNYGLAIAMGTRPGGNVDYIDDAMRFRVELNDYFGTGEGLLPGQGHIAQRCRWRSVPVEKGM